MTRIIVNSKVGADGVLRVTVPVGASDANRDVQVTIEAASPPSAASMTPEQWRHFVLSTAGNVTDPTFVRHEQGEYERREDLP